MQITMAGIDFCTAPVAERERFAFTEAKAREFSKELRRSGMAAGCVVLSTCNRTELWLSGYRGDPVELFAPEEESRACFTRRSGETAVTYLMELAAGLHSQIFGEDQILAQVKAALSVCREGADAVLSTLFRSAVTAGKRVRAKGLLAPGVRSIPARAVALLEEEGATLQGKRCMVIGNGEMGRATATLLRRRGAEVWMTLRQYHKGKAVIPAGCSVVGYDARYTIIGGMDYVFSATRSPHETVRMEAFAAAQQTGRTYGLVDLAVPRDMDPALRTLPGVRLYDLDAFGGDVRPDEERQQAVASEIAAQADAFADWYWFREWAPSAERIGFLLSESTDARLRRNPRLEAFSTDSLEQMRAEVRTAVRKSAEGLVFGLKEALPREAWAQVISALEEAAEHLR